MTYLYAAQNLDKLFAESGFSSRYLYLAKMCNAISKVTNTVTLDTVGNIRILVSHVQSWMQSKIKDLSPAEQSNLVEFISILSSLYDAFVLTLEKNQSIEYVFSEDNTSSFSEMFEILQDFNKESIEVDANFLESLYTPVNNGNLFFQAAYDVNNRLKIYAPNINTDNSRTILQGYLLVSTYSELLIACKQLIELSEQNPNLNHIFSPLLISFNQVIEKPAVGPFIVIFRSSELYKKQNLPFNYTVKNVTNGEMKTGFYTDIQAKVKVFIV